MKNQNFTKSAEMLLGYLKTFPNDTPITASRKELAVALNVGTASISRAFEQLVNGDFVRIVSGRENGTSNAYIVNDTPRTNVHSVTVYKNDPCKTNVQGVSNMKFTVHVDKKTFTKKPLGSEIGGIKCRLYQNHSRNSLIEIDTNTLLDFITSGCTIQPCVTYSEDDLNSPSLDKNGNQRHDKNGKPLYKQKYEFREQQLFLSDLDNAAKDKSRLPDSEYISYDRLGEILEKYHLPAALIYESFSSKPDFKKFRVGFLLDEPVTDENERKKIIAVLMEIFGKAVDTSCGNIDRIFYGSKPNSIRYAEFDTVKKEVFLKLYEELCKEEQPESLPELPLNLSPSAVRSTPSGGLDKTISPDFDPDVLLDMIDPNSLDYNEWLTVSASYKFYETGTQSFDYWLNWCKGYQRDNARADKNTWNSLNGKDITKGTLLHFAELHSPSKYHSYVDGMNAKSRELKDRKAQREKNFNGNQPAGNNQLTAWTEVKEIAKSKRLPEIKFPVGVFPEHIEKFIDSACKHIQVDRAMIGSAVLATCALACQGRFNVMHPSGNGHKEELPLFIAISADPGERKSASLKAAYSPIREFQKQAEAQYNQDLSQFTAQTKLLTLQENQAEKTLSRPPEKLGDSDREYAEKIIQQAELDKLNLQKKKPKSPCILMDDATPEAVLRRMTETGGNVATFTAESGFIQILAGMYNNGNANIDLILKSYDREPYTCDRVARGTQTIETPTQTICAFVQPALYSTLLTNETFRGRGFSARFLTCRPEKKAGTIDHRNNTQLDATAQKQYTDTILEIMKNPFVDNPPSINWEQTAANFAIDYMNSLEKTMQENGTMKTATDYAAKAAGRYIRICGILHLLNTQSTIELLSLDTAQKAQELHDYYFRQSEIEVDAADNMEDKITELIESAIIELTGHGKKTATVSDIWQKVRKIRMSGKNCFNNREDFNSYLDSIEETGKIQVLSTGKRKDVHVNPFWMKSVTN